MSRSQSCRRKDRLQPQKANQASGGFSAIEVGELQEGLGRFRAALLCDVSIDSFPYPFISYIPLSNCTLVALRAIMRERRRLTAGRLMVSREVSIVTEFEARQILEVNRNEYADEHKVSSVDYAVDCVFSVVDAWTWKLIQALAKVSPESVADARTWTKE